MLKTLPTCEITAAVGIRFGCDQPARGAHIASNAAACHPKHISCFSLGRLNDNGSLRHLDLTADGHRDHPTAVLICMTTLVCWFLISLDIQSKLTDSHQADVGTHVGTVLVVSWWKPAVERSAAGVVVVNPTKRNKRYTQDDNPPETSRKRDR